MESNIVGKYRKMKICRVTSDVTEPAYIGYYRGQAVVAGRNLNELARRADLYLSRV